VAVYVGTSAWGFKDWRGTFYPDGLPQKEELAWYARRFPAVEVDSSFYAEPAPAVLRHWAEVTPEGFRFALKVPQSITHERLLKDCAADLLGFLDRTAVLGRKRGPVILQLPPTFGRSRLPDLYRLLDALPPRPGVSVELRHRSAFTTETFEQVRSHGVGLVTTDAHSGLLLSGPDVVLRLLGKYSDVSVFDAVTIDRTRELEQWAERVEQLPAWIADAWVFVSNHYTGHAPATAAQLARRLHLPPPPDEPGRQAHLFR
jgi:uncharacterized protein YecE (DUF72 family)